ncbi:UNVERIFIED_CONTAM: hypothetical protein Sangu_0157300 [Sesamum angustifolium]|uniref:Uncharacterized protein n=1 Tax=Sesamum angustifolium TaxID=2727405 RepID=A0AAW2RKY9_9LAMI
MGILFESKDQIELINLRERERERIAVRARGGAGDGDGDGDSGEKEDEGTDAAEGWERKGSRGRKKGEDGKGEGREGRVGGDWHELGKRRGGGRQRLRSCGRGGRCGRRRRRWCERWGWSSEVAMVVEVGGGEGRDVWRWRRGQFRRWWKFDFFF